MKKLISILLIFGWGFIASSQEQILFYHSDIKVEESGDLLVTETITVQAEGNQIKRGIFRTFPTTYKDKMGTRFRVDFEVLDVLKDGKAEPFFTKNQHNGITVYIGDEDKLLKKGEYSYSLSYRTTRQIGFFEDFDVLYFNAIGGDWAFPIQKAQVQITLPEEAEVLQMDAFTGVQGSTQCACNLENQANRVSISTTQALQPKEQLTFAVAWPKGVVKEPTSAEKRAYFFKNNAHILFAVFALVVVFLFYFFAWKKVGVDPPKGTIIPLFDPPAGFSPSQIAVLHEMRMSQRVLTASLVNMAVKGYIKIHYAKKKYSIERIAEENSSLSPEEEAIAKALFTKGNTLELKNKNHSLFTKAVSESTKSLKKQLSPTYFSFNYKYLTFGILASIVCTILCFVLSPSPLIPILFLVLMVILLVIFTYLIKAPTLKGRAVMDDIEGFKMYLNVAEKDQLNYQHEPDITPERFEALLPYAIALGVENQWGKKFEKHLAKTLQDQASYQPAWYIGAGSAAAFSATRFSKDVGSNLSSAISSSSSPPGSSSGSGGGGFSGGGGGGGGGGGW